MLKVIFGPERERKAATKLWSKLQDKLCKLSLENM
jgi:hypothetical protein